MKTGNSPSSPNLGISSSPVYQITQIRWPDGLAVYIWKEPSLGSSVKTRSKAASLLCG
jgi:hypothetical protein